MALIMVAAAQVGPAAAEKSAKTAQSDGAAAAEQSAKTTQSVTARGLAIAREADRRDQGFGDTTADLTMALQLSPTDRVIRTMRQMVLEVEDDGDKSIMVFDRPRI